MLKRPNSRACALETTASFLALPIPCIPEPMMDARARGSRCNRETCCQIISLIFRYTRNLPFTSRSLIIKSRICQLVVTVSSFLSGLKFIRICSPIIPFYAYIIRTVVTRHVSYQFTHIYNLNAWLPLFHSMLTLSEQ